MEQSFVAWAKMRARGLPGVKMGIGDDAAVIEADGEDVVVTTDTLMEGVHFVSTEATLEQIGRKLVSVNLSDLAAMAAEPTAVFLSMTLPRNEKRAADEIAAGVYEGVCAAAEEYQVALAGGDTNCWDGPLVLNMTAVGRTQGGVVWSRSGAEQDDVIIVTAPLGGSILGKHLDFTPRLDLMRQLRSQVPIKAAMDISDGLSTDLLRMSDASSCGAVLDLSSIPVSEAAKQMAERSGRKPVDHALSDGEDFELLLAVSPDAVGEMKSILDENDMHVCGSFTSRTGLWAKEGGRLLQMTASGYMHQ